MKRFFIVDGASSGNGLSAGVGVIVKDEEGNSVDSISRYIGEKTNNEAEYEAVIDALEYAIENKLTDITILTDSQLVFKQITGGWSLKTANLSALCKKCKDLAKRIKKVTYDFVPREYTHEADALARRASEKGVEDKVEKKYPFLTFKK